MTTLGDDLYCKRLYIDGKEFPSGEHEQQGLFDVLSVSSDANQLPITNTGTITTAAASATVVARQADLKADVVETRFVNANNVNALEMRCNDLRAPTVGTVIGNLDVLCRNIESTGTIKYAAFDPPLSTTESYDFTYYQPQSEQVFTSDNQDFKLIAVGAYIDFTPPSTSASTDNWLITCDFFVEECQNANDVLFAYLFQTQVGGAWSPAVSGPDYYTPSNAVNTTPVYINAKGSSASAPIKGMQHIPMLISGLTGGTTYRITPAINTSLTTNKGYITVKTGGLSSAPAFPQIQITIKTLPSNSRIDLTDSTLPPPVTLPTPLIEYTMDSNLQPTIDNTKVDYTTSTFGGTIDATNVSQRFQLVRNAGTDNFTTVGGKSAMEVIAQRYQIGSTTDTTLELFDQDASQNMWNDSTVNLHTKDFTFSIWVYITAWGSGGSSDMAVVSSYGSKLFEFFAIGYDQRPVLWYYSGGSPVSYMVYKMDKQLSLNTWHNIVFSIDENTFLYTTNELILTGYVDGVKYNSYLTPGTIFDTHYRAVDHSYYAPKPTHDANGAGSHNVHIGSRYPSQDTLTHSLYLRDMKFYQGVLTDAQVQKVYTDHLL
jgi:hypothetical protein